MMELNSVHLAWSLALHPLDCQGNMRHAPSMALAHDHWAAPLRLGFLKEAIRKVSKLQDIYNLHVINNASFIKRWLKIASTLKSLFFLPDS